MECDKCRRRAIIHQRYSGVHLCQGHFIADFESKAKKIVRFSGGLSGDDHILIACHGDYRGVAMMHFLAMLTEKRRGIRLSALIIDEGGHESVAVSRAREFAATLRIPCIGDSDTKAREAGASLQKNDLERIAHEQDATKIICDTCLDDEALFVFVAVMKGEPDRLLNLEKIGGTPIPRIRPFLHIPGREVALYVRLTFGWKEPFANHELCDQFLRDAKGLLSAHTALHPSAPHALVNLGERLRSITVPATDVKQEEEGKECERMFQGKI